MPDTKGRTRGNRVESSRNKIAAAHGDAHENAWIAIRLSRALVQQSKNILAQSRNYFPWGR